MIARRVALQLDADQRSRLAALAPPRASVTLHQVRPNDWQTVCFEDRIPTATYFSGYGDTPSEAVEELLDKLSVSAERCRLAA